MNAQDLLKQSRPREALPELQAMIRAKPEDAKLRVFLFQLQCVLGDWDKAIAQLQIAAQMDAKNLLMAQVGRQAILCEKLRAEVFAGKRSPLIVGESSDWIGMMVQACQMLAEGNPAAAAELRAKAFDAAPATSGTIEYVKTAADEKPASEPFEWIADADARLGPVLELVVDGRYYWAPFDRLKEIRFEKPADLRDCVWLPAHITWSTAASTVAIIPARYAGTEASPDGKLLMSRATEWIDAGGGGSRGLGERLIATDAGEFGVMSIRRIALNTTPPASGADGKPVDMPVVRPDMTGIGVGLNQGRPGGPPGGPGPQGPARG